MQTSCTPYQYLVAGHHLAVILDFRTPRVRCRGLRSNHALFEGRRRDGSLQTRPVGRACVVAAMPQTTAPGDEWGEGDFNAGLTVDDDDLSLLLANWGAGCSPAGEAIPEPATLALLAVGGWRAGADSQAEISVSQAMG